MPCGPFFSDFTPSILFIFIFNALFLSNVVVYGHSGALSERRVRFDFSGAVLLDHILKLCFFITMDDDLDWDSCRDDQTHDLGSVTAVT